MGTFSALPVLHGVTTTATFPGGASSATTFFAPEVEDGFAASAGAAILGGVALGVGAPLLALDIAGVTPAQIFEGAPSAGEFSASEKSFHDTMLNSAKTLCSTKWTPTGTVPLAPEEARACGIKQITDTYNSLHSGQRLPGSNFSDQESSQAYQSALQEWEATHPDVPVLTSSVSNPVAHLASDYLPPLGAVPGGAPAAFSLPEGIAAASGAGTALAAGGTAAVVAAKALPGILTAIRAQSGFIAPLRSLPGISHLALLAIVGVGIYLVLRHR